MNTNPVPDGRRFGKAHLIGAGFVLAFAASVFTVIYTGLMVEGLRSEFDDASRFVTMTVAEERAIELFFESPVAYEEAYLQVSLPAMLELAGPAWTAEGRMPVTLEPGANELSATVRATVTGNGYLIARVLGDEPIGLNRVFVTVVSE